MNESSFYCVLPFFGRKDARYRLEPFRDNVRFRFCGWPCSLQAGPCKQVQARPCFLFWELWPSLAAWDSLLVIQSVTCCDVFFHQLQFVEFGLVTLVFCDSSKLLFVSLPVDTGIFLKKVLIVITNGLQSLPGSSKSPQFGSDINCQLIQLWFYQVFLQIEAFISWRKLCYFHTEEFNNANHLTLEQ